MELPHLGEHCSVASCNQFDFLPFDCKNCKQIFCQPHFPAIPIDPTSRNQNLEAGHLCAAFPAHKADARAVTCPVCSRVIPTRRGEDPNKNVNEHIQAGCPEPEKVQAYVNACTFRGCEKRELVPIKCPRCGKTFCIRHRNEVDHKCPAASKPGSGRNSPQPPRQSQPQSQSRLANMSATAAAAIKRQTQNTANHSSRKVRTLKLSLVHTSANAHNITAFRWQ
ncbi:AN1-type zinc finger protein 2B-like protein [Powellomyces hirtus]|nr:AN1-type zinc finger protein 2B-like protein [Powellomyces hirtus]